MINRIAERIRSALLYVAGNVSLFVFTAFLVTGILCMEPMVWYREQINLINQYVVFPWGMALCLLRLERKRNVPQVSVRKDLAMLFVLLLWIVVPFALRFGVTFNNMGAWHNHAVAYFGIYGFLSEQEEQSRERAFDLFLLLCGVLSIVLGTLLLYCAVTASTIYHGAQNIGFGLADGAYICHGVHYNLTGMTAVCLAMLSLAGAARSKRWPLRMLFSVSAALMLVVIVLTQSRTARYSAIIALGIGTYGVIAGRVRMKSRVLHQATAIAAAAAVLVVSYVGAARLTDAALAHYAEIEHARAQGEEIGFIGQTMDVLAAPALAEEEIAQKELDALDARKAVDATFSDRTTIWKNLFAIWKENPRHFLIGNGIGRTGSRVVAGTIHEKAGAVAMHNTYLQHTADFGLIGTLLLAAFFVVLIKPLLGVFFAKGERRKPGYTALCMLVIACLATGMMESAPLGAMSPMNMMLIFALALLAGRGRDLALL